jgi:hypothetical protein
MPDLEAMKRDLLAECHDDHVGLWAVVRYVKDEFPQESPERIRQITLDVLFDLLKTAKIEAGFPDSNGVDFHSWPFPADVIIDKIKNSWRPGAPPLNVGEIAWFTCPSKAALSSP